MRIAVLAAPESWYRRDLTRAAEGRHEIVPLAFTKLRAEIIAGKQHVYCGETRLNDCDAVLVRTMPPGTLEQVVFRMDLLARLEAAGALVLNPPRAIEAAVDKFLASARLQAAGLLTPRTIVCQTADDAMAAFTSLGGDVVVKPLFGSEGRGIARLQDEALALRAFKMLEQLGAVLYVQEFIPHAGADLRLLVIGGEVLGMRRVNPLDWRTNVSRGATPQPLEVTKQMREIALHAADCLGAPLAGVDILPGNDGRQYVIEVNAVPGWQALSRTLNIDVAKLVLEYTSRRKSEIPSPPAPLPQGERGGR